MHQSFSKIVLSVFFTFLLSSVLFAQQIKVACIGDSVTYGMKIKDREENCYPAQLQNLLGSDYKVENFGYSGATALKNGHKPYTSKEVYQKSLEFEPNIVIIHLGLNDQGLNNWPFHKYEFMDDYTALINSYKALATNPKVFICQMSPSLSGHRWFEEGMRENYIEIQKQIKQIGIDTNVQVIDLHEPLYRFPELIPDNLHPNKKGATIIANQAYSAISGNYGGLKLPVLFGEKMVLQRHEPIVISGTANAGDEITVRLNKQEKTVAVQDGSWEVELPSMTAGGPYKLKVKSNLSDDIEIKEVFVGEVWLASGQSNMALPTSRLAAAESIIKDSINPNVHLFSFKGKAWPGGGEFDAEELENCNANDYFETSGWATANSENVASYSGIAYAYAYNLQKKLGVPVGIIDNSVGGSGTQSWISRETMETTHQTVDLLNDTHLNPLTHEFIRRRKTENFKKLKELGISARHPFDPTMLFDAGINPIKKYNIKGVIWYQGESNAERIDLHEDLFELLVSDWRQHWKKPKMPFYYVQLSSIKRPTWGHFRDSQRRLLKIPNTGMAISSDVGHPRNVHPTKKWIVGERLSLIALAKNYNFDIPYSGPMFDFANVLDDKIEVHFKHSEGLKTADDEAIKDIQIAGADLKYVPAKAKIENGKLILWSEDIENPRYVKYGYSPYTTANLVNQYNLPASTFSNYIE